MVMIKSAYIYVNGVPVVPYGMGWCKKDFSVGDAEKFYSLVAEDFFKLIDKDYKNYGGCQLEKIEVVKNYSDREQYLIDYFVASRNKRGDVKKCFILRVGGLKQNDN